MKNKKVFLGIIGAIVLIVVMMFTSYNGLNSARLEVDNAYSKIDVQLQRRYDLIPNLVNITKGYMAHEKEIFTSIAEARAKIASAKNTNEKIEANTQLDTALSRLLVIQENYPQLKSDTQAQQLMAELAGSENRIQVARTDYNAVVTRYNKKITSLPTAFFAGMLGFEKANLYRSSEASKTVPNVNIQP